MTTASVGPRPKESLFYAPVIYLIAKHAGFKAYVGVDHTLLQDDAIRLAGFDPEDCPWPLKSTSSKQRDGLYRIVHFGWYHQTRQYRSETEALCCRPMDPATRGKRGYWALTDLGVKKAKALRALYEGKIVLSSGPNQTARYLGDNWGRFYGRAQLALRRKMPRSEQLHKVDDHVMNWVEKVMQRDGLRGMLEKGRSIAPSQISGWARKAAYTQIRNEGREPVCRVFHGALTPKEIKALKEANWTEEVIPRTINESDILCHNQYAAHSESDWVSDPTEAIQDEHATAQVYESVADPDAFEFCLDRVSKIIMGEIAPEHDPAFHCQLVHDKFVKEMTVREIADTLFMEKLSQRDPTAHQEILELRAEKRTRDEEMEVSDALRQSARKNGLNCEQEENRIKIALSRVRDVVLEARKGGAFNEFLTRQHGEEMPSDESLAL